MHDHDPDHSAGRRRALGALGSGLAAGGALAMSAGASAQPTGATGTGAARPPMQNPRTQYPRPPFDTPKQEWPGLASKMVPVPDHGERSYVGSGRLTGRKALVTGGDSGIGRAAAIAFAREGADVAINYLPQEEPDAREVVALIRAAGRKAVAIPGDLRDAAFCKQLVAQAVQQLGGLDILVNNAARQTAQKSLLDIDDQQLDDTLKTNLYALFWVTRAALPHLPAGAAIINTASIVADDPPESLLDYATTKGGIVSFTKSLAKQLAPKGIRVNAVAPGPYWTPLQPSGGQFMDKLKTFGADGPTGRPGQPAEIAPIYVLLASQESSFTTGSVFSSVGGRGNVG
ncbi:NAD(P)-dependent dehydrogenase (short-subunit alcohol dehydrogenase family) [Xanthomonas sacchari]|nr:NAD(P)-dependent dehydrogenase (short-subunit alcohol dehydrogenase family) [Xanthomonas sacchari]